jgi:signal transduction histidine kinase
MGLRLKSIRQRIVLLVLVPVLSLIGLYAFAASITARDAINLARTNTLKNATGLPTGAFLGAINIERPLAMVYLASPSAANLAALKAQGAKTSAVTAALHTALTSGGTTGNASAGERAAIAVLLADAARMPALRSQVAAQGVTRLQAYARYNAMVADGYNLLNQVIRQETSAPVVAQSLSFVRMGRSEELLLRENALLLSDMAGRSFPAGDQAEFAELVGARRALQRQTLADLDPVYRAYYARDVSPQAAAALVSLENAAVAGGPAAAPPPVRPQAWQQAVRQVSAGMSAAGLQASDLLTARAARAAHATYLRLILAGGLGLLAVLLSILVSILVGRGLVRELAVLRDSALDLANKRLPAIMARLRAGEDVEDSADAPAVVARSAEIGQVGQAFGTVQKTAVEAAAGEARLRRGINEIFRNLARRSQSLLHRQLSLLDAMERKAAKPEELDDLFRIDHLTTRMRRHAESLIILAGDAPARGWRNPVPLVDVLRAAVAEVEDYTRIKVTATTRAALAGPAVGDIIHMIAELAENAAIFSPPNTPVVIGGDIVGRGFAVEIEDRGLGLSEEKLAEINSRLENPPPFDLSGSDQLGLFVAGQLAKRHDVRISLRPSPYGGTTAIVLIPISLVVPEGAYDTDAPAEGPGENGIRRTGRPAGRAGGPPGAALAGVRPAGQAAVAAPPEPAVYPGGQPVFPGDLIWPERAGSLTPDPASTADLGELDLPQRVRQASMAPQLRDSAGPAGPPGTQQGEAGLPGDGRSPEEARATVAAIQRGWQQGRSLFDAPDRQAAAAPGAGPAAEAEPEAGDGGGGENIGARQGDE